MMIGNSKYRQIQTFRFIQKFPSGNSGSSKFKRIEYLFVIVLSGCAGQDDNKISISRLDLKQILLFRIVKFPLFLLRNNRISTERQPFGYRCCFRTRGKATGLLNKHPPLSAASPSASPPAGLKSNRPGFSPQFRAADPSAAAIRWLRHRDNPS